jgi:hypothetical protein
MATTPNLTASQNRDNLARRKQARKTLDAYADMMGPHMHLESDETLLCDILADCMHLMGREAVEGPCSWRASTTKQRRKGKTNDHRQPHPRPAHGQLVRVLAGDGRPIR